MIRFGRFFQLLSKLNLVTVLVSSSLLFSACGKKNSGNSSLENENKKLKKEVQAVKNDKAKTEKEKELKLESEKSLNNKVNELQEELASEKKRLLEITLKLSNKEAALLSANSKLEITSTQIGKLEEEKEKINSHNKVEVSNLESKIKDLEVGKNKLINTIKEINNDLKDLKDEYEIVLHDKKLTTGQLTEINKLNQKLKIENSKRENVCSKSLDTIKTALDIESIKNNFVDLGCFISMDNYAILDYSIRSESIESVKFLLDKGADSNALSQTMVVSKKREPLLITAVKQGSIGIVKLLLDAGAKIDITDDIGNSSIFYAAKNEDSEMIDMLLFVEAIDSNAVNKRIEINTLNNRKETPLLYYIKKGGHNISIIEKLIANGLANDRNYLNLKDIDGNTVLHKLVNSDIGEFKIKYDLIVKMLDKGSNINIQNNIGQTVVHMLVLYETKNKVDESNSIVKYIILNSSSFRNSLNVVDKSGFNILNKAVTLSNKRIVKLLLDNGANPNIPWVHMNMFGNTLHLALNPMHSEKIDEYRIDSENHIQIIKMLVNKLVDVKFRDHLKRKPCELIDLTKYESISKILGCRADIIRQQVISRSNQYQQVQQLAN